MCRSIQTRIMDRRQRRERSVGNSDARRSRPGLSVCVRIERTNGELREKVERNQRRACMNPAMGFSSGSSAETVRSPNPVSNTRPAHGTARIYPGGCDAASHANCRPSRGDRIFHHSDVEQSKNRSECPRCDSSSECSKRTPSTSLEQRQKARQQDESRRPLPSPLVYYFRAPSRDAASAPKWFSRSGVRANAAT